MAQTARPLVPVVTDQSALNLSSNFGQPGNIVANAAGDVAFSDAQNSAVFLQKAGTGTPIRLFQSKDPVPGVSGALADYVVVRAINASGSVEFNMVYETATGLANQMLLYDGTSVKVIADSSQFAANAIISGASALLNDNGDVSFVLNVQGVPTRIYVVPAASSPVVVAAVGSAAPGGTLQSITPLGHPQQGSTIFNNNGEVVFLGTVNGNSGLYVASIKNGIRKVVALGDAATGGGTFIGFNSPRAAINNLGQVVFFAVTNPSSIQQRGIWVNDPTSGVTRLIASTATPPPVPGGGGYGAFTNVLCNDQGDVLFHIGIANNATVKDAILRGEISGAAPTAVAYGGEAVAGGTLTSLLPPFSPNLSFSLNSTGTAVFLAQVSGTQGFQNAIYTQSGSNAPVLAALDGQASGDGSNFSLVGSRARILGDNSVAFTALETGGSAFAGIFHSSNGAFQKLVNSNDPLPSGARISLRNGTLSPSGSFLPFYALNAGGPVSAFVVNTATGVITKIGTDGDSGPGVGGAPGFVPSGVLFGGGIYADAAGDVALDVNLAGSGSKTAVLLWTSTNGFVTLIADGDKDPATGQTFALPSTVATSSGDVVQSPINNQGTVLITTTLFPSGQQALYRVSPGAAPAKVIATGDVIGGLTVTDLNDNGNGADPQLNASGQVAFNAGFSDGSYGLYLTTPTGPAKIVKQGDVAPNGLQFSTIPGFFSLNNSGEVAFFAGYGPLTNGVSSAGVFIGSASTAPQSVALDGAPAPSGGNFSIKAGSCVNLCFENLPNDVLINDEHDVAFSAALSGINSDSGYFLRRAGAAVQTVALQGQPAPGTTFNFTTFTTPGGDPLDSGDPGYVFSLSPRGELAFQNLLPGQPLQAIIPDLVATFYYGLDNSLTKVVAPGDAAPGTNGGQITQTSFGPGLLANGMLAFWATTPGGATADAIYITANPVPVANTLAPPSVALGQPVNITITGSNIVPGAVVEFNGTDYAGVTSANGTTITATIPEAALQTSGTVLVLVVNPAPGGGASNALSFTISAPATPAGIIAFTPPPNNTLIGGHDPNMPVNLGNVFTANSDMWVTSLGFYAENGWTTYVNDETVTIYDSAGNALASAVVSRSGPVMSRYYWQTISPLHLQAGQQYTVSMYVGNNAWTYGGLPATPSQITFNYDDYFYPPTPAPGFPTQTASASGPTYYGPNFTFVNAAPAPGFSDSALAPNGLTNWYRAEGNALDTQSGANGTVNGAGFTSGKVGQAFSFNGSSNVTAPASVGNFGTNDFSVDFWFNTTQSENFGSPITLLGNRFNQCSDGNFLGVRIYSFSTLFVELDQDGGHTNYSSVQTPFAVNDGQWHHVAIVRQGTTLTVYFDGTSVGSSSSAGITNITGANPFVMGQDSCTIGYSGSLDEVHIFNRALTLAEVDSIYNAGSAGISTLVGWWPFNEGSGTTTADLSGNGNDGTLTGNTLPAWTTDVPPSPYNPQYSLSFDGITSAVQVSNGATSSALNFQTQVSMAAWVKPSSVPGGTYGIISKPRSTTGTGWALRMENNDPDFGLFNASVNCSVHAASNPFTPGVWTHVAATYDSSTSTVQLFVNGASVPVDNQGCQGPLLVAATPLLIGEELVNGGLGRGFPGEISDARVYNRILSAAEVAALAQTSSSIHVAVAPSPLTYGQTATLTATVLGGGSPATDGQVNFFDDQTAVKYGVVPVQNGIATLSGLALPAGTHVLVASYFGSATLPGTATKFLVKVSPAVLTVTPDTQSMAYGGVVPTLTATISGFVNGDAASIVTGAAALSTPATAFTPAGSYPIFASQGSLATSPNYTFAFAVGTLTVTAASPITLPAVQGNNSGGLSTYVTPYSVAQNGWITSWQTEFFPGTFGTTGLPAVPASVQLKIFRNVGSTLQVVAQGAIHDPRPVLQQLPGYPNFALNAGVVTFNEAPVPVLAGDLIGITVTPDPAVGGFTYPTAGPAGTLVVPRNVLIGQTVNPADPFTASLPQGPSLSFNVFPSSTSNPLSLMNNYFVTGDYSVGSTATMRGTGQNGIATAQLSIPTGASDAVNGIPDGADIMGAFLYWQTMENTPVATGGNGTFDGYSISGQQIGKDAQFTDAGTNGTLRVYRADVLPYFALSNGVRVASGTHTVTLSDGHNALPFAEGATLVVIYRVMSPNFPLKAVVLYDGAAVAGNNVLQLVQGFYDATISASTQARVTNFYESAGSWTTSTSNVSLLSGSQYGTTLTPGAWGGIVLSTRVNDSDNDGILDAWKTGPPAGDFHAGQPGYYDAKFGQWIPLPGAAHGQKDLFVQMDYMCSSVRTDGTCDPNGRSELPVVDAQGNDPTMMLQRVFANHGIALHLQIGNAIQAETCTDSPGQLCQFPNEPGVVDWKLGHEVTKLWPRNPAGCAAGGDCSPRFPYGAKDSYHYVLMADSLAIPEWNTTWGTLTGITVATNGGQTTATITTTDRGSGVLKCPARISITGALGNPGLNGVYDAPSCPSSTTMTVNILNNANVVSPWTYPNPNMPEPVLGITSGTINSISGFSDLGGSDTVVSLGKWETSPNQDMSKHVNVQVGTILHEVGHTLGLSHGGTYFDNAPNSYRPTIEANCKPNYQSVMNYMFQIDLLGPNHTLELSNQQLPTINESTASSYSFLSNVTPTYPTSRWYVPSSSNPLASAATAHCDGTAVVPGISMFRIDGPSDGSAPPGWTNGQDINYDGQLNSTMRGFNDWANVDLRQVGATSGQFVELADLLQFGNYGSPLNVGAGGNVTLGSGGTVTLGSGGSVTLGSGGSATLSNGGTIALGSGGSVTLGSGGSAILGSAGTITMGSGGNVILGSGGNITVSSGGTITFGSGGTVALGSAGNVTLGSGGTILLGSGGTANVGVGGTYTLDSSGGTIVLGAGGSVTLGSGGNVTLGSGGTVTLGSGGSVALGSGGTVALGSGGTIALGSGGNVILGSGGNVTLGSGGTITLGSGGNVTLGSGGNVTLGSGGTVTLGSGGNVALGSGGNVTLGSGGTVALGSGGNVTLGSGGTVTLGSGGNIALGSGGTVTLGSGGSVTLGSAGTVALGSGGNVALGSGGTVTLGSGGTVTLGSGGTVALGSGGSVVLGAGGSYTGSAGDMITVGAGGNIALGSGGTIALGSGGNVTLGSGGTITLGSGGNVALGSGGTVTLGSGGTVTLGSGGTVTLGSGGNVALGSGGNVTLGSGGTVALGSGGNLTLGSGGNVTLGSGGNTILGSGGNITLGSGGTIALGSGGNVTLGSGGTIALGSGGNVALGSGGTIALGSGGNIALGSGGTIALGSGGVTTGGSEGGAALGSGGVVVDEMNYETANSVVRPPELPTATPTFSQGGTPAVAVNWSAPAFGVVTQYTVYRSDNGGPPVAIGTVSGNPPATTFLDTNPLGVGTVAYTISTAVNEPNSTTPPRESPPSVPALLTQTISFAPLPNAKLGDNVPVSATASSGLTVAFSTSGNCSLMGTLTSGQYLSPNMVNASGVGTCTVTATQGGNDTYAAANVSQTFSITNVPTKSNQTITFLPLGTHMYGDSFTLLAMASSNLPVSYSATGACMVTGNTLQTNGTGSCTVTASQAGNNNYNAAASVSQSFTINPANQTISFAALPPHTYGDPSFSLLATASSNLPVSYSAMGPCTVSGNTLQINGTGSCTVTASQAGNNDYNPAASVSRSFTINPANQTISFAALPAHTYGDSNFTLSATASSNLPVSYMASGNCTVNGVSVQITGAGSCSITASQAGNADYNPAAGVTQSFAIAKAVLTVTADNKSKTLDAANPSFTASYAGFKNGDTLASSVTGTPSLTTTATTTSPVGSYPITPSVGTLMANNYSFNFANGKLTILYASSGACDGAAGHAVLPPVDPGGTSVFKQGRTVPVQFRVCDANGISMGTPGVVTSFLLTGIYNGTLTTEDDTVYATNNDTAFRWDSSNQQWIFNLSTGNLSAGKTYIYTITLNDGTIVTGTTFAPAGSASFQFGLK